MTHNVPRTGFDRIAGNDYQVAVNAVVAFRNRAVEKGAASDDCLDRANAVVSLAYGAEFPLSGLSPPAVRADPHGHAGAAGDRVRVLVAS